MKSCRLLVFENETGRMQAVLTGLTTADPSFSFESIDNPAKCLHALADNLFDVLLIDGQMRGLDPVDFVEKLRDDGFEIPILFLSEAATGIGTEAALAAGADEVIAVGRDDMRIPPRIIRAAIETRHLKSQVGAYERRLLQCEKMAMLGLLAGGIAHDLRNPLNTIETARYYLAGLPGLQEPELQEKFEVIHRSVQRASGIITNLLEFSRPSKLRREAIDLHSLLDGTLALFGKEFSVKKIEVVKRFEKIPLVVASLDALKQVFLNLLMNAAQAMPKGGTLVISTSRKDKNAIEVSMADTGAGIANDDLQRLFTPFFTTKPKKDGVGLGLYISKLLIDREGGEISVTSKKGEGAIFSVSLPVAGKPAGRS